MQISGASVVDAVDLVAVAVVVAKSTDEDTELKAVLVIVAAVEVVGQIFPRMEVSNFLLNPRTGGVSALPQVLPNLPLPNTRPRAPTHSDSLTHFPLRRT